MFDYKNFFVKLLGLICIIAIVFIILSLGVYFLPFLIAILVAMILRRPIEYLTKKMKINNKLAVIIMVCLFYGIIGFGCVWVCFKLIKEAGNIINILPDTFNLVTNSFKSNFDKLKNAYDILPDSIANRAYDIGMGMLSKTSIIITNMFDSVIDFIKKIPAFALYACVTILATYFIASDKENMSKRLKDNLPGKWYDNMSNIINKTFGSLAQYIKAQLTLAGFTFIGSVISFLIVSQKYPFTIALVMGLLDILPIVGIGAAFLPWAFYCGVTGNIQKAVTLLIIYTILISIRQMLEPKIVSSSLGVRPIFTLFSMFLGFKIFGFLGMIFGPIIAIILKDVLNIVLETGYIKSMFINKNEKMVRYFKKYE